jgi:hypothetical protein
MSNIIADITEDIDIKIKPSKTNFYVKWGFIIAGILISGAFIYGQFSTNRFNRLNDIEKNVKENTETTTQLKQQMTDGFVKVNARIDKVYDDGYLIYNDFQQYNKKQFELFIDYGNTNKDLLKRMLELNNAEKNKDFEIKVQQAKKNNN